MTTDDRDVRIDAIAAKALMLSPGDTFAVQVSGGHEEARRAEEDIEHAIERQYEYGREMVADLAHPDELATRCIVTQRTAHLIIERVSERQEYVL